MQHVTATSGIIYLQNREIPYIGTRQGADARTCRVEKYAGEAGFQRQGPGLGKYALVANS